MSQSYDAVIIGSGHNALITAAYLSRTGWSVIVLEQNDRPGGLLRTEELIPGFIGKARRVQEYPDPALYSFISRPRSEDSTTHRGQHDAKRP
jgi:choline dehydrogenase-like flavoprotein